MIRNIIEQLDYTSRIYPHHIAFAMQEQELSFSDLQQQSKAIATELLRNDSRKNEPIVVYMEKTPFCISAFLGIARSGNFYVPIDITMPIERIKAMLEVISDKIIVVDQKNEARIKELYPLADILLFDTLIETEIEEAFLKQAEKNFIDTDPLYMIYTSGSTGIPKGVVVSHQSVLNLVSWYAKTFDITEKEVIGNQAPFHFDSSVKDIYTVLSVGARMELIPKQLFSFPIRLMEYVQKKEISYIDWVPSALVMIANTKTLEFIAPRCLKKIVFVGEVMPTKQFNVWRNFYQDALFANLYGPTETTVDCMYYIVEREFSDDEPLPIGYPCENTDVFLLNGERLAGVGEIGEICVRGRSVSYGYYDDFEKTQEAFIQNPLNPHYRELIYKTGDIAKYNAYGEMIFVSRKDHQIKHMGHRIELGEIEMAVKSLDLIEQASCIYDEMKQQIVLFYCGAEADSVYILKGLKQKVSKYMFPNQIILQETLPLTTNGKVDKMVLQRDYADGTCKR